MTRESSSDQQFRAELLDWFAEHLVGEFAEVAGRGGPGDDDAWDVRLEWERELGRGGWIGLGWPREYGGREASMSQQVLFHLEYARAGAPARCAHFGEALLAPTLLTHGTPEQKARFLPPIAGAEQLWCQGYSEPGAGSDLAGVRTTAVRDGEQWVINGQKLWTTFAHRADWIFLLARTEPSASGHRGLSYLLCPLDQAGVEVRPITSLSGAPDFNEVFFTDARTDAANVVGPVGAGWQVAMSTLGHERATSVLAYQFSFQQQLDAVIAEIRRRGLGSDPVLRQRVADLAIGLQVLRVNNLRSLATLARSGELGPEASVIKLYWSRWHQQLCRFAMDVLGLDALRIAPPGGGYEPSGVQRSYLTSMSETIYAGTTEIQLNIVGERVLGLPKEPPARQPATAPKEPAWTSR